MKQDCAARGSETLTANLTLRSAQRVSKSGNAHLVRNPSFETLASLAPQDEVGSEGLGAARSAVLSQLPVDQLERFERERAHVGDAIGRRRLERAGELLAVG